METLKRAIARAVSAEREACAQIAENRALAGGTKQANVGHRTARNNIAADIRARGQQPTSCPDCRGIGYDASGQLCWCQDNLSF